MEKKLLACYQLNESENDIRRTLLAFFYLAFFCTARALCTTERIGRCLRFTFVVKREMWITGSRTVNESQGRFREYIQMLTLLFFFFTAQRELHAAAMLKY